jgi:uncharacterized metal-binding protein YceD (DUF177 family)
MKILKEDIPAEGLEASFSLDPARIGALSPLLAGASQPPSLSLRLKPVRDNMIQADGTIKALLMLYCSRCLKETPFAVDSKFSVVFHPRSPSACGKEEVRLGAEDLEVYFYDGVEIDLDSLLLSELEFLLPLAPLCDGVCLPVCPHCGKVGGGCACGKKQLPLSFSRLAELKFDND